MSGLLISDSYKRLNSDLHESNPFYGTGGGGRAQEVAAVADKFGCLGILDYGCGKGDLTRALLLRDVREYDPAIPGKDQRPEPAHLVFCGDVLEHIEPEYLEAVLDDLASLSLKAVLFMVHTGPARKTLADGRNAHLTQQPPEWWLPRFWQRWKFISADAVHNGMRFVGCTRST